MSDEEKCESRTAMEANLLINMAFCFARLVLKIVKVARTDIPAIPLHRLAN